MKRKVKAWLVLDKETWCPFNAYAQVDAWETREDVKFAESDLSAIIVRCLVTYDDGKPGDDIERVMTWGSASDALQSAGRLVEEKRLAMLAAERAAREGKV